MRTENEDKIKVLEKALNLMVLELSLNFGICDALYFAVRALNYPSFFCAPSYYGIELPPRIYSGMSLLNLFSYPATLEGRQQRIEVLQNALNKLKNTMNKEEREALIEKIILSEHKGMGMRPDYLVYNDRFSALSKLSDAELLNQSPELN